MRLRPWSSSLPHSVTFDANPHSQVLEEQLGRRGKQLRLWSSSLPHSVTFLDTNPHSQVLEEQLGRRGDAVAPLEPMLQRTLADIQERLTFRAQVGVPILLLFSLNDPSAHAGRHPGAADLPGTGGCSCVGHHGQRGT